MKDRIRPEFPGAGASAPSDGSLIGDIHAVLRGHLKHAQFGGDYVPSEDLPILQDFCAGLAGRIKALPLNDPQRQAIWPVAAALARLSNIDYQNATAIALALKESSGYNAAPSNPFKEFVP